jgi:hypothetical protein
MIEYGPGRFVNLVLSGGGQRCLAFVGFLRAARGVVSRVRNVYCVSGGAIAGLAFCLDLDDDAVVRIVSRHACEGVRVSLAMLLSRHGLDDAKARLGPMLRAMISEGLASSAARVGAIGTATKPPDEVTFADLARATGRNLVVHATSLSTGTVRVMSVETCPDVSVVDAVCASCAVPLLFCPVLVGGEMLLDGCLAESYPYVSLANHGVLTSPGPPSPGPPTSPGPPSAAEATRVAVDTLVLCAVFEPHGKQQEQPRGPPTCLLDYASQVIQVLVRRMAGPPGALGPRARVVKVNTACDVTAARLMCDGLRPGDVTVMYRIGLDAGHAFLRSERPANRSIRQSEGGGGE